MCKDHVAVAKIPVLFYIQLYINGLSTVSSIDQMNALSSTRHIVHSKVELMAFDEI